MSVYSGSRVAVTGASGFIGSALCALLLEQGATVLPVPHSKTGAVYPAIPDAEVLFHVGGGGGIAAADADPAGDLRAHATSTLELLAAQREGRFGRLVLLSSAAVYGRVQGVVPEDTPARPLAPYGVSKRAAELYVLAAVQRHGTDAVIGRLGNPYGPGQRSLVVYDLAKRALTDGAPFRVFGAGDAVRDFLHVRDVAMALQVVGSRAESGSITNIGSGQPVSILELARTIAVAAGLPPSAARPDGEPEPGKVNTFAPDVTRLAALGFEPCVALPDGIAETVAWVRSTL